MIEHRFSLEDINNMIPWEREIYLNLVQEHVRKENERNAKENERINRK
jgi:hypothetical protein|tara:strand:+ start:425 stop:568 length:144 start_codon:yes stop_codon:yes gene_type:complete